MFSRIANYNSRPSMLGKLYSFSFLTPILLIGIISRVAAYPTEAAQSYNQGTSYFQHGQYQQAIPEFTNAISIAPEFWEAYQNRGLSYYHLNDTDHAFDDFSRTIALKPDYAPAYADRGSVYSDKHEYDNAIEDCNQSIAIEPSDEAYVNLGFAYSSKGVLQKAATCYGKAIQLNPQNSTAYNDRAIVYNLMGKYALALVDINHAIKLAPGYIPAYFDRANSYNSLKRYNLAIADYTYLIEHAVNPPDVKAYFWRAKSYLDMGDYEASIKDMNLVIAQDGTPGNAGHLGALGWIQYLAGKYTDAISSYLKSIELDDSISQAHFDLGLVYAVQGEAEKANTENKKGLKNAKSADFQIAIRHLQIAIKLHPASKTLPKALAMLMAAHASAK